MSENNTNKNDQLKQALEYWANVRSGTQNEHEKISETALSVGSLSHASYLVVRKALDKASEDSEHEDDALMLQGLLGLHQIAEFMSTYLKYDGDELKVELQKSADKLCNTVDLLPK